MKELNGSELAGFIKERQAKTVRALRQAQGIVPTLLVLITKDDPTIEFYTKLKLRYGEDILVDVDIERVEQANLANRLAEVDKADEIHGVIVQLPLADPSETDKICEAIPVSKDVDGMAPNSLYESATATAIDWLLSGYNVNLQGKRIVIVGKGKLVGRPLMKIYELAEYEFVAVDLETPEATRKEAIAIAEVLITATGAAGSITADMIAANAVVVDAGSSSDDGVFKGDLAEDVYNREDITVTPRKGGVGPLTVAALFENVIRAAQGAGSKQ